MEQARNVAAAYNQSIYLMILMPYTLLGVFGYLIYRGVKKNEKFRQQHGWPVPDERTPQPPAE